MSEDSAQHGSSLAIVGATLIDGTGKEPIEHALVLVEGSKITRVGRRKDFELSASCEVIDGSELVVMPGLVDCHVHLTGCRGDGPLHWMGLVEPKRLQAIRSAADARKLLDVGFTTVGDMGSANAIDLRSAIEEGTVIGPRIIAAGRALGRSGGHGDLRRDLYEFPDQYVRESLSTTEICDGVNGVRVAVRKQQGRGADCIKFYASGGGSWRGDRIEHQQFTGEEMEAIVAEAHMYGLRVAAHAENLASVRASIRAGVDRIEHGDVLDQEICKEMVRKGIVFVPTISAFYVGPWAAWEAPQKSFQMAYNAGVKIALGSDAFAESLTPFGKYNIGELKKLVEWGMSPMEAITSGTRLASEALGIANVTGTLQEGKFADILLVKGNPLADIEVLLDNRNISVIKEGKFVGEQHT